MDSIYNCLGLCFSTCSLISILALIPHYTLSILISKNLNFAIKCNKYIYNSRNFSSSILIFIIFLTTAPQHNKINLKKLI